MSVQEEFTGEKHDIPFAVGVVRGVRSFRVGYPYFPPHRCLVGVTHSEYNWKPGENIAECWGPGGKCHSGGIEYCAHGFYAYHDGSDDFHQFGMVTGVIEGYGEVVIGSKGFRASKGRIVGFLVPKVPTPSSAFWEGIFGALLLAAILGTVTAFGLLITGGLMQRSDLVNGGGMTFVGSFAFGVVVAIIGAVMEDRYALASGPTLNRETVEMLKQQYPDVPHYRNKRALLKAHPLHSGLE